MDPYKHRPSSAYNSPYCTTNQGAPVWNNTSSLTLGNRGPVLLEDYHLIEKLSVFTRERIPERVVHARGASAKGFFEVTHDVSHLTCADFLRSPGVQTPLIVRFSTVIHERGSPETLRDPRGFAVKFYTREGNFDIVGNNIPVFFTRDAIQFPDVIRALKPNPKTHIQEPWRYLDYLSHLPESCLTFLFWFDDWGIPSDYRHMEGFGVHTFKLLTQNGKDTYCKFHWKPTCGQKFLLDEQAVIVGGTNHSHATKDLQDAIASGNYPEWKLYIQTMNPADEAGNYNCFFPKAIWSICPSTAMEKEEVLEEIEAVEAVYGSDCQVLLDFPPHVKVSLKPRTADDLSQQFVEAILVIRANPQYPMEPPELELIDSKGLDDHQHSYLLSEIQNVAKELVSCPMLVALCEAAIERLSDMNYPAGNCSFCLFPLVMEDAQTGLRPFMKLMSCFHCFHSDCFGRWWRWVQKQNQLESISLSEATVSGFGEHGNGRVSSGSLSNLEESNVEGWHSVKCPVCCKVIRVEDVDHVRHFLGSDPLLEMNDNKSTEDDEFLSMDQEEERRKTFADIFKVQQDHGGIIEPKKLPVILPGMFLHNTVARPVEASTSSHEGISSGEEVSLGQGSVETAAAESSDIPSSSTGSLSAVGTMPTRGQTEIERLDGGRRELHIGRRGSNNNRRHFTRRSSHVWKQR